jgi:hypothetical protein
MSREVEGTMRSRNTCHWDSREGEGGRAASANQGFLQRGPLPHLPARPGPIAVRSDRPPDQHAHSSCPKTLFYMMYPTGQGTALSLDSMQALHFPCRTTDAHRRPCVGTESNTSADVPEGLAGGRHEG